jgi:hypothetical protein
VNSILLAICLCEHNNVWLHQSNQEGGEDQSHHCLLTLRREDHREKNEISQHQKMHWNLDAHIAATGFPYDFRQPGNFIRSPVMPKVLCFSPKNTRIHGWCWDNLLEASEKDIFLSSSPEFNLLDKTVWAFPGYMLTKHLTRAGHNFHCPFISPLSVDPLINGTALICHFENINLMEERLFLSLYKASALKI